MGQIKILYVKTHWEQQSNRHLLVAITLGKEMLFQFSQFQISELLTLCSKHKNTFRGCNQIQDLWGRTGLLPSCKVFVLFCFLFCFIFVVWFSQMCFCLYTQTLNTDGAQRTGKLESGKVDCIFTLLPHLSDLCWGNTEILKTQLIYCLVLKQNTLTANREG